MRARLGSTLLPVLVVVVSSVTILVVLARPAPGGMGNTRTPPPLGSATLVFTPNASADPQAIAVRLAGTGAYAYDYGQLCGQEDAEPPRFILPVPADRAQALLDQARVDPDVRSVASSIWPCGGL